MQPPELDEDAGQTARLRALHDATREMVRSESRQELYRIATSVADDVLGFEFSTVREYDEEAERLVPVVSSPTLQGVAGERVPYERGDSVQWQALDTAEILVFQSVSEIDDDVNRTDSGSMLVVPLGDYGVLTVGTSEPDAITDADIELARVFGANFETARERLERVERLREREQRLQEKTDRLDRFSGMLAHEFRNPITIAAGQLDFVSGTEADQPHLDKVRAAVDRMDRITENLLDLARDDTLRGPTEPTPVDALAAEVFGQLAPPTATLNLVAPVTVRANRARLRTVFENLIDNAVEYAGRDVTLWTGPLDEGGFYVADDGPGFGSQDIDTLFSYRASTGSENAGLGLAIVRDIAVAHGWTISVCASRAGGARIEFRA